MRSQALHFFSLHRLPMGVKERLMDFTDARALDMVAGDLVWSDFQRAYNRARINGLLNGDPPFNRQEKESAKVVTNLNDLVGTSLAHDGRAQMNNGLLQQGQYATCRTDWPSVETRDKISSIVEKEFNRPLLDSTDYFECIRAEAGQLIAHGMGTSVWENPDYMIPTEIGMADLLCPTNTRIGFKNLPFIFLRRSFTGMEFAELYRKDKVDPGWNRDMIKDCLKWVSKQMTTGLDSQTTAFYRPEQWEEENKQDAGWYAPDRCPTIDVFDIYGYREAHGKYPAGWVRRIMLDQWSGTGNPPAKGGTPERRTDGVLKKVKKGDFLYTSDANPVCSTWNNITSVQYGDLSAVFPAMHNSVRGLGWIVYSLCHIQNRLKSRFYDSVFEQLLQYFQVSSMDDVARAMKVELAQMGFIDETIKMVKAQDRWTPDYPFVEGGLGMLQNDIQNNSKAWTQNSTGGNEKTEKTKFQYMAELQRMNVLVSAAMNQMYFYQKQQDREMFRRFCRPNSRDPIVRRAREQCIRQGVEEKWINNPDAWDVQHERMMGQGNQTLEMMVSSELLQMVPGMAPEQQVKAKRNHVNALTHNPQMAIEYFPDKQDENNLAGMQARTDFNTMLGGIPVPPVPAQVNRIEYAVELLKQFGQRVETREKSGGMVKPDELQGLKLTANCLAQNIQIIEQDKTMAPVAKKMSEELGKITNLIKAFEQRLQAAAKKQQEAQQQNGDGGEQMAKVAAPIIMAKTKAKIKEAEAQQKMQHKDAQFKQQLHHEAIKTRAGIAKMDLETAAGIKRNRVLDEGEDES
jgi:hypothetical protein